MTHYAILDNNAGLLQWIGKASEEGEAFDLYCAEVGITDPVDQDVALDGVTIHHLTSADAKEVRRWWDNGGKSNETPECINGAA